MKVPWEDKLPCAALALLVLAVFYGIYFAKMLAQKRRGIQTRQIGRRKEKDIRTVEVLMSMATLGAPIAQLLSIAFERAVHRLLHRDAGRRRLSAVGPLHEGQLARGDPRQG